GQLVGAQVGADRRECREDGVDRERAEHGQAAQQQGQAPVMGNPMGKHRLIVRASAAPTTPRKLYLTGSTRWEKRPRRPRPEAAAEGANARNRSGPTTAACTHSGETGSRAENRRRRGDKHRRQGALPHPPRASKLSGKRAEGRPSTT